MANGLKNIIRTAGELLYPSRCPLCGKIEQGICSECAADMKIVKQPCCFQCGKPVGSPDMEFCPDCRKGQHCFEQGFAPLLYEGKVKEAIHKIKYSNKREYLWTFAQIVGAYGENRIVRWKPEVLIPVPMYRRQKRKRGYNPAEILAEDLGEYWNLPVDTKHLEKKKDTGDQKELSRAERRRNLCDAFYAHGGSEYRSVLLIDDVYTTGSTVDAAALTLKKTGIEHVFYAAICIGHGDMLY